MDDVLLIARGRLNVGVFGNFLFIDKAIVQCLFSLAKDVIDDVTDHVKAAHASELIIFYCKCQYN